MKETKKGSSTIVSGTPEIDVAIQKFGVHENNEPAFVIVGLIKLPKTGWNGGILAFADNEIAAYNIRKILLPYGDVSVRHTEHHPEGKNFSTENAKILDELLGDDDSSVQS